MLILLTWRWKWKMMWKVCKFKRLIFFEISTFEECQVGTHLVLLCRHIWIYRRVGWQIIALIQWQNYAVIYTCTFNCISIVVNRFFIWRERLFTQRVNFDSFMNKSYILCTSTNIRRGFRRGRSRRAPPPKKTKKKTEKKKERERGEEARRNRYVQ